MLLFCTFLFLNTLHTFNLQSKGVPYTVKQYTNFTVYIFFTLYSTLFCLSFNLCSVENSNSFPILKMLSIFFQQLIQYL